MQALRLEFAICFRGKLFMWSIKIRDCSYGPNILLVIAIVSVSVLSSIIRPFCMRLKMVYG